MAKVKTRKPKKHNLSKSSTERVVTTTLPNGDELQTIIKRVARTSMDSSKSQRKVHTVAAKHFEKAAQLHRKEAQRHKRFVKKQKNIAKAIHSN